MVVQALMVAGVAVLPLPALVLGARGVPRRGYAGDPPGDRVSRLLVVALRLVVLLLVLALTGVTLLALVAALVRGVTRMPGLLFEFFFLDLLLAALVLATFGRGLTSGRRPARRRASPAARSASSRRPAADPPRR